MNANTTRNELTYSEDATIIETAVALKCELLRRTCGPAQILFNTYRKKSVDYQLEATIRGWEQWTDDTAEQFVRDCIDAACSELENNWFQALEAIGHPAIEDV